MERYRIGADGGVYFVTMSVVEWLPVFVSEAACKIVAESLNFCHHNKALRINAYVVMPSHLHGIVFRQWFDPMALKASLTDFRKFTGQRLSDYCGQALPRCFAEVLRESSGKDRVRRFWQPTFHPEAIVSESFWRQKLDYLHDNPRRKGLVGQAEYWRFSSASYWASEGHVPNDVILSAIDW